MTLKLQLLKLLTDERVELLHVCAMGPVFADGVDVGFAGEKIDVVARVVDEGSKLIIVSLAPLLGLCWLFHPRHWLDYEIDGSIDSIEPTCGFSVLIRGVVRKLVPCFPLLA
jgi:hypothetical protein